jgi:hypothetical protein
MWAFGITWHSSFVVCHLLTFPFLIFSSEIPQQNELKLSRRHLWKVLSLMSAHFVMIHYQAWPPQAILVSDWSFFLNVLYEDCSFRPDWLTNMATTGNSCF